MRLDELAVRARALATGRRAVLGIAGPPGAGKSTLVEALLAALRPVPPPGLPDRDWVAHLPMDGFHLADVALDRLGRRDRKGAPDTFDTAGYVAMLRRLRAEPPEDPLWAPGFSRDLEQPLAGAVAVPAAARLVLTEGNYLLLDGPWAPVRALLDEVWFVDPDGGDPVGGDPVGGCRRDRLLARHLRWGKSPTQARDWVARVDDPNAALVAATRHRAHLVVRG